MTMGDLQCADEVQECQESRVFRSLGPDLRSSWSEEIPEDVPQVWSLVRLPLRDQVERLGFESAVGQAEINPGPHVVRREGVGHPLREATVGNERAPWAFTARTAIVGLERYPGDVVEASKKLGSKLARQRFLRLAGQRDPVGE